ncbi:hypothetical protein [Tsukamurella spumae]|uniref:Uncharacterized protein n=1 Tax=Tsukamurella spumae TaxID=44753 RepID=A0A846X3M0_9ACTN|nr:hypothetical protein [Tsukamurella spumae]NKY19964.1 hypothetical protein [Tsukamurella spumae]
MRSPGATDFGAGVCVGAALGVDGALVLGADGTPGFGVAGALGFGEEGTDGEGADGAAVAEAGISSAPDTRTVTTPIVPRRSAALVRVPSAKVEPS